MVQDTTEAMKTIFPDVILSRTYSDVEFVEVTADKGRLLLTVSTKDGVPGLDIVVENGELKLAYEFKG